MRRYESFSHLVKPAITVFSTVFSCVVILLIVHPWRGDTKDQAGSVYLSADARVDAVLGKEVITTGSTSQGALVKVAETVKVPPAPAKTPVAAEITTPKQKAQAALPPLPEAAPDDLPPLPANDVVAKILNDTNAWDKAESERALEPLMSYEISKSDLDTLDAFVKAAFKSQFTKARELQDKLSDPVAIKFAQWYYYRRKAPDTEANDIIAFLEDNPLWPGRDDLQESVEDALFWREKSQDRIITYFAANEPVSGAGLGALGSALIEKGETEKGKAYIKQAWRRHPLTPAIEKRLRKLKVLSADDHRARAGYLLMQDNKRYVGAAKRVLPLIEKKWQKPVKAHIATVRRARNAGTLLTRLDPKIKKDPAILFARIQWLRRNGNDEKSRDLLKIAPNNADALIDPEEWWDERQRHIRSALNDGDADTAYALAKGHNEGLDHWDLSDAEFLAGWIAFRFKKDIDAARTHFLSAVAAGGLPKRRSRADYWLGRVETEAGNMDEARARYAEAAHHYHTFYGQLANQMISSGNPPLTLRHAVRPGKNDIEQFVASDVMKAMVIAQKAGFENLLSLFMYDLAREIESAPQMTLLCELARRIAPPHRTIRMAKIAINRDFAVQEYAYPRALPDFDSVADGQNIETALIHALTRQESEFNPEIVSSAGAVGLMQLLPSTAKFVAGRHKVKYRKDKLSKDPSYNVALGSAFLHQLISNYDGSYIMALVGYNAGPGRVRRWSREFGDPREPDVDPIDWIERIPFTETRDYVHKILESAQVYRSRLINDRVPVRLAEDLYRGRSDKPRFLIGSASN